MRDLLENIETKRLNYPYHDGVTESFLSVKNMTSYEIHLDWVEPQFAKKTESKF